jgi:hypothetical protein
MTEHLQSPRIGGDGATDRRTVTAGELDPVGPSGKRRGHLDVGDCRPGMNGELAAQRVDVGDPGQSAQAEHDLAGEGDPSADEPRVAPLGHEGDSGLLAHGDHGSHLGGVTGPDDGARLTSKAPGPVDAVRSRHIGFDGDVRRPNSRAKLVEQAWGHAFILAPAPRR